eukprot:m.342479 g.342479  ORF g.342479 m.342479 type:complete len:324 (+) comp21423_c0_seq1:121-1092(+)
MDKSKDKHAANKSFINPKFLFVVGGIYASYLMYGVLQEEIMKKHVNEEGERFKFTWTLLIIQCLANIIGAIVGQQLSGPAPPGVPMTAFLLPGTTYIIAMLASNEALKYISYPTQILAKSCKMLPVMFFQILFFGAKYKARDYAVVVIVTLGIILFQMKDKESGAKDSMYGIILLLVSLAGDGITSPNQEKTKKQYGASPNQMMLYCNLWAFMYLLVGMLYIEGFQGLVFIQNDSSLIIKIMIFCVASGAGQNFIFMALHQFGALVLATVTTTRKFFTVFASVLYFGHVLSAQQWAGVSMVIGGLLLELYGKYEKNLKAQKKI